MDDGIFPAWHNGKFCQTDDLKINVKDLGLTHGEGLYDVLTIRDGRILGLDYHLDRFAKGCKYQYISALGSAQIFDIVKELYQQSNLDWCQVMLIATRGVPKTYHNRDILKTRSELIIFVNRYSKLNAGVPLKLCVSREVKRIPDWAVDQRHKNFARQDFNRAAVESFQRGFSHPLLLSEHGYITEGPQFNVAIIKDNEVLSPAKNCLAGITMKVIQNLCNDNGIVFKFTDITQEQMIGAEDAFATCTLGGITTISTVEHREYQESNLQKRLKELYDQAWQSDKFTKQLKGHLQ